MVIKTPKKKIKIGKDRELDELKQQVKELQEQLNNN